MDTERHVKTCLDTDDGIQNGIQNGIHKAGSRSMRAVVDSRGNKIPQVYLRSGIYYARIVDPSTGSRTLRASPDGTLEGARRLVRESKKTQSVAGAQAFAAALEASRQRSAWSSIASVLAGYEVAADKERALNNGKPTKASSDANIKDLRRVYKDMGESLDGSCSRAPEIVAAWAEARLKDGSISRVSVAAISRRGREVFSGWAMRRMRAAGLRIDPSIPERWSTVKHEPVRYQLPPQELRERTIAAGVEEIRKRSDIGLAFLLCYYGGMSKADVAEATWDILRDDNHLLYYRHKTGRRADPPLPADVADALRTWPGRGERDTILPGAFPTQRDDLVRRDLAAWMRGLGWTTQKCAHELRKLACSTWATQAGIQWAARWIGDSEATASAYYRDLLPERAPEISMPSIL